MFETKIRVLLINHSSMCQMLCYGYVNPFLCKLHKLSIYLLLMFKESLYSEQAVHQCVHPRQWYCAPWPWKQNIPYNTGNYHNTTQCRKTTDRSQPSQGHRPRQHTNTFPQGVRQRHQFSLDTDLPGLFKSRHRARRLEESHCYTNLQESWPEFSQQLPPIVLT